jgi:nitrite reductase/ring-hydroxylating ferredoxin subunit
MSNKYLHNIFNRLTFGNPCDTLWMLCEDRIPAQSNKEVSVDWIRVAHAKELSEDTRQIVEVQGHRILLLMHEGQPYAVLNGCPHMGIPLRWGTVTEDRTIVCPFHHSVFDLETGEVKAWSPWPPVVGSLLAKVKPERPLTTFPAKIEKDAVWIGVDEDDGSSD